LCNVGLLITFYFRIVICIIFAEIKTKKLITMETITTMSKPIANNLSLEKLDLAFKKNDTIKQVNKKVYDCIGRIKNTENPLSDEELNRVVTFCKTSLDYSLLKLANATVGGKTEFEGEKIDVLKERVWHRIEYVFERFDYKRILMNE
jgi:hypothetical protein